jgi:hypothetical protein
MRREELFRIAERHARALNGCGDDPWYRISRIDEGMLVSATTSDVEKFRVRIATQQFLAEVDIRIVAENGELASWQIPQRYKNAAETKLTPDQAIRIVNTVTDLPRDAIVQEISQGQEPDSHITSLIWSHVINGIEVETDGICVQINSATLEIISFAKTWHTIVDYECNISRQSAQEIGQREAPQYMEDKAYEVLVDDLRFIPIEAHDASGKRHVRFTKVWVVNIREDTLRYHGITQLCVDCRTGQIVRVNRSR